MEYGPESLTDRELLGVILRTGRQGADSVDLADDILKLHPEEHGLNSIPRLTYDELVGIQGIGKVKAIQILCIGELSKRIAQSRVSKKVRIMNSKTAAEYYMEALRYKEQEYLIAVMLNTRNQVISDHVMTVGTVNASLVSPREIFLEALRCHAVRILLIHNHPSGDPSPSEDDKITTDKVQSCGELLHIPLLDHLIIGDGVYYSFAENKLVR
ncbi:MAG: DNA repair protein RadC [Lachnospiraceae bacterium]|nr:DNA repair protein RadC [Candidatus Equihabitans merdae]